MQTSNFQCGHCGKPFAVEAEYLDRQVRCPHCLQVVLARALQPGEPAAVPSEPAVPPEPAPEPVAALPESVTLTPPTPPAAEPPAAPPQAGERPGDVFPHVDFPAEPPFVGLAAEFFPPPAPPQPAAETLTELLSTVREEPPDPLTPPAAEPPAFLAAGPSLELPSPGQPAAAPAWQEEPTQETSFKPEASVPAVAPAVVLPRERRPAGVRSGVSIWYVLPLVSYSIFATCLVVILWNRLQATEDHPLVAFLPDAEGDAPGVVRKPKAVSESGKRKLIGQPLPEALKVRLGQTRTIGALAVTPQRVTRERVGVARGSAVPEKLDGPSLVLHLRLKNVSEDESFQPLDRYFDRKWREGSSPGPPPLTLLEAGPGRRFFGGPAAWRPRRGPPRNNDAAPEFIYLMTGDKPVEDPVDRPLGPGESEEVFVCTDGADPRADELSRYRGEFLWRVHLRRGLVRVRGHDGREREVPAAAVVGVVFSGKDVGG